MATIEKQFVVAAPAERVWNAFRDLGAVHTRLARRFVADTRLDGDSRLVTFANGTKVRERFVTIDEARRRLGFLRFDRGLPPRIYCDHGTEFVSGAMDLWAYSNGVTLDFSRRGKPTDNAAIESFTADSVKNV